MPVSRRAVPVRAGGSIYPVGGGSIFPAGYSSRGGAIYNPTGDLGIARQNERIGRVMRRMGGQGIYPA